MSLTQEPTISSEPEPEPTAQLASVTNLTAYKANKAAVHAGSAENKDAADASALKNEFWNEGRFLERRNVRRSLTYTSVTAIAVMGIYEYMKVRGR